MANEHDEHEGPEALPPAGGTSEAGRPGGPVETDALTLEQAAQAFEVSQSTLYRRAQSGQLVGAFKAGGRRGLEWRVPVGTLEQLYRRKETAKPAAPAPDAMALARVVDTLTERLAIEQRLLEAAAEDRRNVEAEANAARVELARAEAQLEAERTRTHELDQRARQLEYDLAVARRRWWQRKPEPPKPATSETAGD